MASLNRPDNIALIIDMFEPLRSAIKELAMNSLVNKVFEIFEAFPSGQCRECDFGSTKQCPRIVFWQIVALSLQSPDKSL